MFNFLNDELFINARQTNHHFYFKDISLPLPDWSNIIACLNYNYKSKLYLKQYPHLGFVTLDTTNIPVVKEFLDAFQLFKPEAQPSAHVYISMTDKSCAFGKHRDGSNLLFWQVIGRTRWTVYDEEPVTYFLEPNDAIYVPAGMYHNVKTLEPRVGISLGLDYV